jgi:hypothetical protein
VIGGGTVYPNLLMAMDSGLATGQLEGVAGREPAFGLEAIWIDPALKPRAETMNYTVGGGQPPPGATQEQDAEARRGSGAGDHQAG